MAGKRGAVRGLSGGAGGDSGGLRGGKTLNLPRYPVNQNAVIVWNTTHVQHA
jgi:hypothetical protein